MGKMFNYEKGGFSTDTEIELLYIDKAKMTSDKTRQEKLFRASMYDPRKSDIYFGSEKAALKAEAIAKNLQKLTKIEFMDSDYPFVWLDELAGESIFKVVNKKKIKLISPKAS